jgi:hypothetical protein
MNFDDIYSTLLGIPPLPGSLCRGRAREFDEYEDVGVTDITIATCGRCPAQPECDHYWLSLRPCQRPLGVMAGRINRPAKPRKRKAAA